MDRNAMKVQALLEKISALTTNYENQIADMRVELTITRQELQLERENNVEEPSQAVSEEQTDGTEPGDSPE